MRQILVTGGAGFIGSNFVHHLIEHTDAHVTILDKMTYAASRTALEGLPPERVRLVVGDVADRLSSTRWSVSSPARRMQWCTSRPSRTTTTACVTPSRSCRPTSSARSCYWRRSARTTCGCTTSRPTRSTATSNWTTRHGSPSTPPTVRPRPTRRARPVPTTWCGRGRAPSGCAPRSATAPITTGPGSTEKFIPRQITNVLAGGRPKVYGTGAKVRDWIHTADHSAAVLTILERGSNGQTYLIGADGERSNLQVVRSVLSLCGRDPDDFDYVTDRAGHDLRYTIDAGRLRAELGWEPAYPDFEAGLGATIAWYRDHQAWWSPAKADVESSYAARGQ